MKTSIGIRLLAVWVLLGAMVNILAQDGGFLPDLCEFPSGTFARVAAVGAKIHGNLDVTESDPVTGHVKRRRQMVYFPPTEVYWTRMGTTYEYTDPAIVARYSNPSLKDGRDVVSQRTTIKLYRRDGSAVGYTVAAFAGGAVDRILEFEPYGVDVGMPSPGFVGRPLENLTFGYMAEIEFRPKVSVFSVPTEESRTPDYTMFGMLQRLRKAAGEYGALIPPNLVRNAAATDAFVEDLRGIYQLGEIVCTPMKAKNSPLFSNEALVREISSAIANWEITMAGIQQQMESSAYAYWDSLSGRTDPWDAYRMEGVAGYHIASFFLPGWVIKGAGKARMAGKFGDAAEFAAKAAKKPNRFVTGVEVTDRATGKVFEGTVDLKPTIDRINSCQPFPHRNDGEIFNNYPLRDRTVPELPVRPHGYYREFVHPTPGIAGPGPQRIVVGQGGEWYYTPNHYEKFIPLNP
jgi:guanyl-specific ribonuclease Sa